MKAFPRFRSTVGAIPLPYNRHERVFRPEQTLPARFPPPQVFGELCAPKHIKLMSEIFVIENGLPTHYR